MKVFTGRVIHTKLAKTALVEVVRMMAHPVYGKRVKRTKKYLVHDELGVAAGDMVQFVACKPVSKKKKWKIVSPSKPAKAASKEKRAGSAKPEKGVKTAKKPGKAAK